MNCKRWLTGGTHARYLMFWLQPSSDLDAWAKIGFTEFTVFNKWMLLHKNQVCFFGIIG